MSAAAISFAHSSSVSEPSYSNLRTGREPRAAQLDSASGVTAHIKTAVRWHFKDAI
jgi:hypothetical protein